MSEETNDKITKTLEAYPIQDFNAGYVGVKALKQMVSANQLKYIDYLIQAEEENKLLVERAEDLAAYPIEIQEAAMNHAEKASIDPDYFTRNQIDPNLYMPIQLVNTIKAKREEAKTKTWKVEYHARLIERLRSFIVVARKAAIQKLISKLIK